MAKVRTQHIMAGIGVKSDAGVTNVSPSIAGTTLIIQSECGPWFHSHVLRTAAQVEAFRQMVNDACDRVKCKDQPQPNG